MSRQYLPGLRETIAKLPASFVVASETSPPHFHSFSIPDECFMPRGYLISPFLKNAVSVRALTDIVAPATRIALRSSSWSWPIKSHRALPLTVPDSSLIADGVCPPITTILHG